MAAPGAITKANRSGVTVKEMIDRYLLEYEKLRPLGKTKRATLKAIGETWLGKLEDKEITSQKLVEYANGRMKDDGIQAQTVGLDLKDWPHYRDLLKLPDFGPISQDKLAIQHIRECRALPDVNAGRIE